MGHKEHREFEVLEKKLDFLHFLTIKMNKLNFDYYFLTISIQNLNHFYIEKLVSNILIIDSKL